MPMTSPDRIALTDTQRGDLDRLVRAGRTEQRLALRAGIVLSAADGQPNVRIAASLGVCEDTARKWRHRWCAAPGVSSLGDAKRCGRPAVFTAVQVAQVKAWPAPHRRTAGCRCRNGRARNWPCTPSAAGSARTSRPRLHLRGTDRYVPQQPLGLVQRRPRLHHAAPESMPQHVRMNRPVQLRPT